MTSFIQKLPIKSVLEVFDLSIIRILLIQIVNIFVCIKIFQFLIKNFKTFQRLSYALLSTFFFYFFSIFVEYFFPIFICFFRFFLNLCFLRSCPIFDRFFLALWLRRLIQSIWNFLRNNRIYYVLLLVTQILKFLIHSIYFITRLELLRFLLIHPWVRKVNIWIVVLG